MINEILVKWIDSSTATIVPMKLVLDSQKAVRFMPVDDHGQDFMYMSDGWIDSHAHVYDGATDLGIEADTIGYQTGVHMVIDAGSSGAINEPCFKKYVLPTQEVSVKAYLNISRVGLVCKQPYYDSRLIDPVAAEQCIRDDKDHFLLGIKVLSSGLIVEHQGIKPMQIASNLAEKLEVPLMAHLVEGPPSNEDTMKLMKKGDIITHCFHGVPNILANQKASRGTPLNMEYCRLANVMWNPDGTPTSPLEKALQRGVYLDVGHGAGSFDYAIAKSVIKNGFYNFSISTDAHCRSLPTIVHSLPHVMSKFLALGMPLINVIQSFTIIPAHQHGFTDWCNVPLHRATLFRLRKIQSNDPLFIDSNRIPMEVMQVIEPVAVIKNGYYKAIINYVEEKNNGANNDT